jgi:hypothetical protein
MGLYNGRNSDFSGCFCAINGTQLLVKFNKAVNAYSTNDGSDAWGSSAANPDNYSLSGSLTQLILL